MGLLLVVASMAPLSAHSLKSLKNQFHKKMDGKAGLIGEVSTMTKAPQREWTTVLILSVSQALSMTGSTLVMTVRRRVSKIGPSDGRGESSGPSAVARRYNFLEFGG